MQIVDRIGRQVRLRDLHILLAVVERGSMARAADDLAVSQPVVSKTIAGLERALGVRLLDRSRNGVEPTAHGRTLLKRATAVFDELRQGVQEMEALSDPSCGEVHVGAFVAMMGGLLPAVIGEVRPRYPRLVIRVTQLITSPAVYDNLRDRNVDFILGRLPGRPLDGDLEAEGLFDERLFVVAGLQSPWTRRRKLALSDLINEPWVLPQPGTEVGTFVANAFYASGLEPPAAAVICSSIDMYWGLLATGRFLATLPLSLLRLSVQRHAIKPLPISLPVQRGRVGIVTLKNRRLAPAAQLLANCIRDATRPLALAK